MFRIKSIGNLARARFYSAIGAPSSNPMSKFQRFGIIYFMGAVMSAIPIYVVYHIPEYRDSKKK